MEGEDLLEDGRGGWEDDSCCRCELYAFHGGAAFCWQVKQKLETEPVASPCPTLDR